MSQERIQSAARAAWLLSLIVVIVASLLPQVHVPDNGAQLDKLFHFSSYAWLGLLAALAFRRNRSAWTVALLTILAGALVEVAQQYVGRAFSYADMAANGLGSVSGVWLGRRVLLSRRRRRGRTPAGDCSPCPESPRA